MSDCSRHRSYTGRNKHMLGRVQHRSHSYFLVCRTQSDIGVQRINVVNCLAYFYGAEKDLSKQKHCYSFIELFLLRIQKEFIISMRYFG